MEVATEDPLRSHSRWQHPLDEEANDGFNGYELWKSDGTSSCTVMVKDIYWSNKRFPAYLTAVLTSISKPPTQPTDWNCGRAMELPPFNVMVKESTVEVAVLPNT